MIQKRITTWLSVQPSFSKWWWMGAIRKTRRPVILKKPTWMMTGRRVFLMAPIHHHFEKLGWTESQVVIRFWIIAVILALIGLSSLKLR